MYDQSLGKYFEFWIIPKKKKKKSFILLFEIFENSTQFINYFFYSSFLNNYISLKIRNQKPEFFLMIKIYTVYSKVYIILKKKKNVSTDSNKA
jgi:hypothetical protein